MVLIQSANQINLPPNGVRYSLKSTEVVLARDQGGVPAGMVRPVGGGLLTEDEALRQAHAGMVPVAVEVSPRVPPPVATTGSGAAPATAVARAGPGATSSFLGLGGIISTIGGVLLPGLFPGSGNGNGVAPARCPAPQIMGQNGLCVFPPSPVARDPRTGAPGGRAEAGRFGGGFTPDLRTMNVRSCGRGFVLASDGLCYHKRSLPNRDRAWPRGRRPLLTGGEMRAISKAAAAAGKLQRTTKRLQKIGMLPKPSSRRRLPPHQHQLKVVG